MIDAGVNHISLDDGNSILTVVGTMDPVCVATRLKKIKQKPVIISVGPPPKPPEPPKPPPTPEPPNHVCKPPYCNSCDVVSVTTYESGSGCTIL